jgi:hypothetical protein
VVLFLVVARCCHAEPCWGLVVTAAERAPGTPPIAAPEAAGLVVEDRFAIVPTAPLPTLGEPGADRPLGPVEQVGGPGMTPVAVAASFGVGCGLSPGWDMGLLDYVAESQHVVS